mgnify:CR=1 FL=1
MAYSVRWAHLRPANTTALTVSSGAFGNSHRTMGSMMREERWTDFVSPEAEKITTAQMRTGNQNFANDLSFDTAHRKPRYAAASNAKARQRVSLVGASDEPGRTENIWCNIGSCGYSPPKKVELPQHRKLRVNKSWYKSFDAVAAVP